MKPHDHGSCMYCTGAGIMKPRDHGSYKYCTGLGSQGGNAHCLAKETPISLVGLKVNLLS